MNHHKQRSDKTCLNCGQQVEEQFCSHCGQENVETRQSFGGLLAHFVEDLTHYEGKFWRSMKHLLFRPGYLSTTYLEGKRVTYIPPVRMYIFISFVTFLLPHFLPDYEAADTPYTPEQQSHVDSLMNDSFDHITLNDELGFFYSGKYKTMDQLNAARESRRGTADEMSLVEYWNSKKSIELRKYTPKQFDHLFSDALERSFPKALFVYMPFFAFVLWLFHGKKKWMYFDHAIFTLHYFSFILLLFTGLTLISTLGDWMHAREMITQKTNGWLFTSAFMLVIIVFIYYFYRAHFKLYKEFWLVSFLKSSAILFINTLAFIFIMVCTLMITLLMLH